LSIANFLRNFMMKTKRSLMVVSLMLILMLAACGGGDVETAVSDTTSPTSSSPKLTADYEDALSIQSQLAIGTLQLEETDLAVDEALAGQILPLWQALQSLGNSETAAEAELTAVVNQIQNTMTAEQISAIADMQLTSESMAALIADGTLAFGRGGGGGENASNAGGVVPPAGGFGGGGGLGGGPGGGQGGIPGGQVEISEDDRATRQAMRESGDMGGVQDQALVGVVVRLLQEKTGVEIERVDPFAAMWDVLTEATGLTTEEIQTQTAEGTTLVELIEANGGDVAAIKADLIESLQDSPIAQRQDVAEYVDNMLTSSGSQE
jgi:hypothetical protein